MKTALPCLVLAAYCGYAIAQSPPPPPTYGCDSAESKQLDFWVGDWELTTVGGQGAGNKSRNRISKIMGGCVILEEFSGGSASKLDGHSVSTFDRATKKWRQTWVDNTASYLDFVGGMVDGDMSFWREVTNPQGQKVKQRMVWKDVKADSLKWLWQSSTDNGATWKTQWEIDYRRLK